MLYSAYCLQVSEGLVLRDGTRLKYPINGIVEQLFFSIIHVLTANVLFTVVLLTVVYLKKKRKGKRKSKIHRSDLKVEVT